MAAAQDHTSHQITTARDASFDIIDTSQTPPASTAEKAKSEMESKLAAIEAKLKPAPAASDKQLSAVQSRLEPMHAAELLPAVIPGVGAGDTTRRPMTPITFSKAADEITISENGKRCHKSAANWGLCTLRCAVTEPVMSSGRHHAEFKVQRSLLNRLDELKMRVGVVEEQFNPRNNHGACETRMGYTVSLTTGRLCHNDDKNDRHLDLGAKPDHGDTFGLVLDSDAGTLSLYKNGSFIAVVETRLKHKRLRFVVELNAIGDGVRVSNGVL